MSSIFKRINRLLARIESAPTSFSLWFGTFFSIIFGRLLVESWLSGFSKNAPDFLFSEFTHTFLFFLLSYILFLWILSVATKTSIAKTSNVLLLGFLVILTPPIIDFIISQGAGYWSFYKFDGLARLWTRFWTFFGDKPEIGITYGVRVEVAISLLFFFLYILVKTKKIISSLGWTLLAYFTFFILGTFPSWITIVIDGFSKGFFSVSETDIAEMFLTPEKILSAPAPTMISTLNAKMSIVYALVLSALLPALGFFFFKKHTVALLRNIRLPQTLYHGGLLCAGAGLGILFSGITFLPSFFDLLAFLLLLVAVGCAWCASVVVNDLYDTSIDALTNPNRPLPKNVLSRSDYARLGWLLFFISLLFAAIAFPFGVVFLLFYQALAFLYSAPPLRFKRIPVLATLTGALASILILFLGYAAFQPELSIQGIPVRIVLLLLFAYTVSLPVKDFKDIDGDALDGVRTIPVIFGETKGRLIVASGIFLSFIASIWALNDSSLLVPATLLGGGAFWTVATSHQWKRFKITPRQLPLALFVFVFVYGIIIVSKLLEKN